MGLRTNKSPLIPCLSLATGVIGFPKLLIIHLFENYRQHFHNCHFYDYFKHVKLVSTTWSGGIIAFRKAIQLAFEP